MNAEQKIMDYLQSLSKTDNAIKEALEKKEKSSKKMMSYIYGEAKKSCEKGENQTCIDSDTVFQWARHYWLEEIETDKNSDEEVEETAIAKCSDDNLPKCQKDKRKPRSNVEQLNLFEFGE